MAPNPVELQLSPFADYGRTTLNVGYRDVSTGQVVVSVEVPSELIERAVFAHLSVEVALSPDGCIASSADGSASLNSVLTFAMSPN